MKNTYKTSILLDSLKAVEHFIKMTNNIVSDVDISQDYKYTVDGKSIMGILSLDLSKPLNVIILNPTEEDRVLLDNFIVKSKRKN